MVIKRYTSAALLCTLSLWPLLFGHDDLYYRIVAMALLYGALALAWNIYALTGLISLGHAAFFGLGAYGSALAGLNWQLPPAVTLPLGALLAAAYAVAWHLTFRRLRGAAFALASLASVEIPRAIADNGDALTGGSLGLTGIRPLSAMGALDFGTKAQYVLLLSFALAVLAVHARAIRSRWGWAIRATREDEVAANSLGVNVPSVRLQALLLSASLTGLCGGLYAHLLGMIEPALVFSLHISALPLILSIVGGRFEIAGPLLGALLLYPLDQTLFRSWFPTAHAALYGVMIVAAILFFPRGIGSWVGQKMK